MTTPRGIRNNNPGNIDRNETKWQGMSPDQSGDPRFIVFSEAKFGLRAIGEVLQTYSKKYGLRTIRALVNRWAPPSENNTDAYILAAAKEVDVSPDEQIDVNNPRIMFELIKAIVVHENGAQFYTDAQLQEGVDLALA